MTLNDLWHMFCDYPDKLEYFDELKNEQDLLQTKEEIIDFVEENGEKIIEDVDITLGEKYIYITLKEQDNGKIC